MKFSPDIELEMIHVVYIGIIGIVWLLLTALAGHFLHNLFISYPDTLVTFIKINYGVGGSILGLAILTAVFNQ